MPPKLSEPRMSAKDRAHLLFLLQYASKHLTIDAEDARYAKQLGLSDLYDRWVSVAHDLRVRLCGE